MSALAIMHASRSQLTRSAFLGTYRGSALSGAFLIPALIFVYDMSTRPDTSI